MIRTRMLGAAAALVLASCQPADVVPEEPARPEVSAPVPLTADGWGSLRIGMTRDEVTAVAGEDANPEAVGGPDPEQCDEFRPTRAPAGMIVMIEEGRLTRISLVAGSDVKTARGFGVGDAAASIKAPYGAEALASPHKYAPAPAEYITVWTTGRSGADPRGIVYEIGPDGRVSHVHAGGLSIQYVEGCL